MIGSNRHDRAGFDGGQHSNESVVEVILLGDLLDPLFFIEGGGAAAHVVVRPFLSGGGLTGQVSDLLTNLLGVLGKVLEQDFG